MGQQYTPASSSPTHVRFGVLGFACSLSLLTYLDRVCISRAQEDIQSGLNFTPMEMGWVFGAFAVGYCLFEVPGGWMGDVWGSRRILTRIVLWWSLFTALTGGVDQILELGLGPTLATSSVVFAGMLAVRFLFGCGEAGAYPNLSRVVGSWFPFRERGLAQGAIWMCARLGGAIAPFVIGRLTGAVGWRSAFLVLGLIGGVWCLFFFFWFRNTPEEKPTCNDAERALIHAGPHSFKVQETPAHALPPWGRLLRSSTMWALCLVSCCVSFGWYFYPTWQPQYLKDVYDISFADSELLTGLPFLCGAAGSLLGGGLSDVLVRVTGSRRWGRSLVGVAGFSGAGLCVLCTGFAEEAWVAVTLLCLAFFINDLAIPPIWAACTDIGGRYAGTVAGLMNMAGGIGAFLSPVMTPVVHRLLPADMPLGTRWLIIFAGLSTAWFIGAVAWLVVDASKPIVRA